MMQSNERNFEFGNIFIKIFFIPVFVGVLIFSSCSPDKRKIDVSNIEVSISIQRFEKDLFAEKVKNDSVLEFNLLEKKYPDFFLLYVERIMKMGSTGDSSGKYRSELTAFLKNKSIQGLYDTCQLQYNDMSDVEKNLETAFKHLKYYYPQTKIPGIYTFISEFSYGIITADTILGIGLDMFLGENYVYYPSIGIPEFVVKKLKKEYIVPNAMKAIAENRFDNTNDRKNLLNEMVYNGKILFFLSYLFPDVPDSLLMGYSQKQIDWCYNNEGEIWNFFLENNLVYSTDAGKYHKFVSDGPTTSGMPRPSPGNVGSWTGWRIVKKYMNENSAVTLQQLMRETDTQKILQMSKYKPRR